MATINYHVPSSSYDLNKWSWGINTIANSTHLQFSNGRYTQDQIGSFIYDGNRLVDGTINSLSFSEFNDVYLTISDINADISEWQSALSSEQGKV